MTAQSSDAPQRAVRSSGLALSPVSTAITMAAVALLLMPGVVAFGPVFGGAQGYLAAGGGVALGLTLGFLSRWRRWSLMSTVAAGVGAYLLFGGAFALRKTTIAGFIPTPDTLLRLVALSVQAWRDLLTLNPPADGFVGPAVVPYLSGLVLATLAAWTATGTRRHLWALPPTLALLVIGILWGLDEAPTAAWLGAGYAAVGLVWAVWRRVDATRSDAAAIFAQPGSASPTTRRLAAAAGVVAIAAALSLLAGPLLASGIDRQVLRRTVQPPLTLRDYASPLAAYRYLEVDQKEVSLFTVAGLPEGARLRLATLDAYDGRVYNVADVSAGFLRIGQRTSGTGGVGPKVTLDVAVTGYSGLWLPGGGDVRGVRFGGVRADEQANSLYHNTYSGTLITTAGVGEGDTYAVDLVMPDAREVAEGAPVAAAASPSVDRVPDAVGKTASDLAGDATSSLEQLRRIEKALQLGYYSNGTDGLSRAGHGAERIAAMLGAPMLVGDDEQYAVAMALMARELGLPARVVMGFYPDKAVAGRIDVTGSMAHVWVEVPFEGAGWVTFDPTPDRDRTPQTQVPKPLPKPKPQVLPPPDPPASTTLDSLDIAGHRDDEDVRGDDLLLRVVGVAAALLGGLAVIVGPFVAIAYAKRRRRRRRESSPEVVSRFSGGWAEIEDAATDLGVTPSTTATRRENADSLAETFPEADFPRIASLVDSRVFGATTPTADEAASVWSDVDVALASMRGQVGRVRRLRGRVSIRSLRRSRPRTARATRKARP